MVAIVMGFTYFSQPSKEEIAERKTQDSIAQVEAQKQAQAKAQAQEAEKQAASAATQPDTTTLFGACKTGKGQIITLQNELVKVTLNTHGGVISSAELKGYKDQQKRNVMLLSPLSTNIDFTLAMKEENLHTKDYTFIPSQVSDSTVSLALTAKDGSSLIFHYVLLPHSYMVNLSIESHGLDRYIMPSIKTIGIDWQDTIRQQEKGYEFEARYSRLTYKDQEGDISHLSETKQENKDIDQSLDWIAFKNQYFSSVLIGYQEFSHVKLSSDPMPKGSGRLKYYHAEMETAFDPSGQQPTTMQMYLGPNQFQLLQKMNKLSLDKRDLKMERLVDLGWPLFRWINRYFTIYVFNWLTQLGFSMGIVLLLLTILLKVLVYPTTRKSYLSSAKMRVLKPKLDEIQKKYPNKEDSMKMQQEIMQTYSMYGVSPMSGCLPILIQSPIWIAMFNFVPNAIELRGQKFLWSNDLSTYDDVIHFSTNIPFIGDHISLFCVLFCASNLLYSWLNMKMQKDSMVGQQAASQMKMMQWMMMLMPIFFFFIFNSYSAGLNYYYWISLLGSAITMWYLKWRTDDKKLLAKLEENYEKNRNNPQKVKGLAARLEALQKQQEMQQKKYGKH